jgi:uncharacterized protein with GYD domain
MPKFAATVRFTDQGIKAIKDTTRRAASFKAAARKMKVKVLDAWWCLGPFDGLLVFEAPDSRAATAAMLALSAQGNVHTQTAELFSADEVEEILQGMNGA